jgi:hypothetical protein
MPTIEDAPNSLTLNEPVSDALPTNEAVGNVVSGTAVIVAKLKRPALPTTCIEAVADSEPIAVIPDEPNIRLFAPTTNVATPVNVDEG